MSTETQRKQRELDAKKNNLPLSQVDPKAAKEKSAHEKLQLWATWRAMQTEGKLPHNDQLDELLERMIQNKMISSKEHMVSQDGKLLLNDLRGLLRTLQKALKTKNKDELFQSLCYHLHMMESPISKEHVVDSLKTQDKNVVQNEGKQGSDALYKIVKLLLVNNEFRDVLADLIDISQDVFNDLVGKTGESLQNAGNKIRQPEEGANRSGRNLIDSAIDQALDKTERSQNHTRSQDHGIHDREYKRNSIHDREPHLISSPRDDPRHQGLLNTGDSIHPDKIPGGFPTERNLEHSHFDHHDTRFGNHDSPIQNHDVSQDLKQHPVYQGARKEAQEHKETFNQSVEQNIPKEKQDELIRRLQSALAQVQSHPEYQSAIKTLIRLVQTWSSRLTNVSADLTQKAKAQDNQAQLREQSEREVKAILESWAQGHSIDPLLNGLQQVMHDVKEDENLRTYYDIVLKYIDRLLREPNYSTSDQSIDDGRDVMKAGREIIKGQYGDHLSYLSNEAKNYLKIIGNDETSQELGFHLNNIHQHLWMDSDGNPAFKPHLLDDIKLTLLPAIIDEIKYVPIPRIEYSDPQFDIIVENLILSGDSLLPNLVETKFDTYNSFSLKSDLESKPDHTSFFVRLSEIQAEIDDVVFSYKKKTGFPRLSDSGLASIHIGGRGISIALRIQNVVDNPAKTFKVSYCKCNVSNMKVEINQSNHDILYKTIRPLVIGQIRRQIARGIELKVTEFIQQLDQRVTQSMVQFNQKVQDKAARANQTTSPTLSQARPRQGLFATLVAVLNGNIKGKIQKHNERKRRSVSSSTSDVSSFATHENHRFNPPESGSRTDRNQHSEGLDTAHVGRDQPHSTHLGQPNAALNTTHLGQPNAALNTTHLGQPNAALNTTHLGQHDRSDYLGRDTTNLNRDIVSPPHSPTLKTHTLDHNPDHFKLAADLGNAQQGQQPTQTRQV